ncbi:hypothetical protein [Sphingomonas bacterium]|uniref:hypothetical protein n=1 Tax=Sphingomonas bacterium TaxID=1895847 RepID=UPI0015768D84|nr:hypothetical protein [Sphingomonas bacterium]
MRLLPHLRLRVDTIGLRGGTTRNDDLTGARFRKLHMTSTIDYYPVAGFHISAGFRSWKSKLPRSLAGGGAGRLNMQSIAPTLPMRSTHANLSPLATIGYQSKIASNALFGIEAGVMSEHGRNRIAGLPANGGASQSWSKTGAVAQASVKMRFF